MTDYKQDTKKDLKSKQKQTTKTKKIPFWAKKIYSEMSAFLFLL